MRLPQSVLVVLSLITATLFASLFFSQTAEALSGRGYFSGRTGSWYSGYGGDVLSGRPGRNAIPGGMNKGEFINFIKRNLNGSNRKDKTGAAFIINSMMGRGPASRDRSPSRAMLDDWEARIRNRDISMNYGYGDPNNYGNGRISFYDGSINDDFFTNYNSGSRPLLIFRHNGRVVYVLEVPCANPIGGLPGLPQPDVNDPPTGRIVDVDCPANGSDRQRIRMRINDRDGTTYGKIRVGSWESGTRNSNGNDHIFNITGSSTGLDFQARTYNIRLYARDKRPNGSLGRFVQVDTATTRKCQPPPDQIFPRVTIDPDFVEVGGNVEGETGYVTRFNMNSVDDPRRQYGYATRDYRGPYIAYQSQMWLDDGSGSYSGVDDRLDRDNDNRRRIDDRPNNPGGATLKGNWRATNVSLDRPSTNNPHFKICIGLQITKAWYEYRTRTIDPPYNHRHYYWDYSTDPRTRRSYNHRHSAQPNRWSNWREVAIGFDNRERVRCTTIQKWPSMEVRSGDIEVGGVFRDGLSACTTDLSDINDYAVIGHKHEVRPDQRGSRSQYGIVAAGPITDFGSNNVYSGQPGSEVLDFANVGGLGTFYGAGAEVTTSCFDDAFDSYPNNVSPTPISDGGSRSTSANGDGLSSYSFEGDNGTLTINGGAPGSSQRRIIRVTSNGGSGNVVRISSPISYGTVSASEPRQLPQFILLVDADVDIKVDQSVETLDGLYVTRGSFHTCLQYDSNAANNNLYIDRSGAECRETLTINGAVIAGGSVYPYRTDGANAGTGAQPPAEIFNLRGDLLISDYGRKQQNGNLETIGQLELPPRF